MSRTKHNLRSARTLLLVGMLGGAPGTFGTSPNTIWFNNRATTGTPAPVVAPVFEFDSNCPTCQKRGNPGAEWNGTNGPTPVPLGTQTYGGAPLTGTGYSAALWGVNSTLSDSVLTDPTEPPLVIVPFRVTTSLSLRGFWTPVLVSVPGISFDINDRAKFVVRAWDNGGGTVTNWQQVLANPSVARGESAVFTVNAVLGGEFPPNLVGFESFQLYFPIPEPSVLALALLGICGVALRKRIRR